MKFKQLRKGISPKQQNMEILLIFTELELTDIITRIMDLYSIQIDRFESLNILVDTLYILSKKLELFLASIWGTFFVIPFFTQIIALNGSPILIRFCLLFSWIT